MVLLIASALAAPCDTSVLGPALTQVENGYLKGNEAEVMAGLRTARKHLACDVTPDLASRYHRANALQFALANNWVSAELHLRAAIAAAPLAEPLAQADSRLGFAWNRAQETPITWKPARPGLVNGLELAVRPDVPYLGGSGPSASGGPGQAIRWAGVGGLVLATSLYTGSMVSRAKYESVRGGPTELVVPSYNATNGLFVGAVATGLLSAGAIGVSFAL